MFWFEGEGKTVDDAAQDLEQLSHTVELFRLIDESAVCDQGGR